MPMLLRSAPASPFARKVRMAILHLGLADKVEITAADTNNPDDPLRGDNPLGKLPVLLTEDGEAIYDSRVILEYLDHRAGGGVIIPDGWPARQHSLTTQALCDGVMDASLLIVYEARHRPPPVHHQPWIDYQRGKVIRGLGLLAKTPPDPARFEIGAVASACALGYLDLRGQVAWRPEFPALVTWLDAFRAAHPEFDATLPPRT